MSTTLTIRTDEALRRSLEERAAASGKSLSEVVREILEAAVIPRPLAARTGHLRGRLSLRPDDAEPWRKELRERNWRR
ncbi:MAG: FitA-like ribbon-helix-helix domain-containing protein [bacterium]